MTTARKAGLFVGINNFANFRRYRLRGCINDATEMRALYEDVYQFPKEELTILTDQSATKMGIMIHLLELVRRAKVGELDHIVFSFSSHGTQVRDQDGDEADGRDEAFVPYDLRMAGSTWDPNTIIVDDELNALFSQVPSNVTLEVFLDTCHSGTGLRGAEFGEFAATPRFILPLGLTLTDLGKIANIVIDAASRSLVAESPDNQVLWTGCRDFETSADAYFSGVGYHGAFTYNYVKVVRESIGELLSRQDILGRVRANMANKFAQTPQLEASPLLAEESPT